MAMPGELDGGDARDGRRPRHLVRQVHGGVVRTDARGDELRRGSHRDDVELEGVTVMETKAAGDVLTDVLLVGAIKKRRS